MSDSDQRSNLNPSQLISMPQRVGFGLLAAIGVWTYWPSIVKTLNAWGQDPDYSHGYFVVPLSMFLLWRRRKRLLIDQIRLSWVGLSLILLAGIMRYVAGRFYLQEVDAWSIPIFIGGLVWTFFGWHTFLWAAPSVFFLWFATPMPGTIANWLSLPLQLIAAQSSTLVLQAFGQLAIREGTVILVGDQPLDVARACSGLRMFYGITALAIAFVLLTETRGWRAVVMIVSSPPVAVFTNVLRISITVLLYRFASSAVAENFMHDLAGIFLLPLAVVMFMQLNGLINRIVKDYGIDPGRTLKRLAAAGGAFAVLIVALYFWVTFQQGCATRSLLVTAERYEVEQDWPEAARYLRRYLAVEEDDKDVWLRFVDVMDKSAEYSAEKVQLMSLYRDVWTRFPEEYAIAQRGIELAMEIGEDRQAIKLAGQLLEGARQSDDEDARRTAIHAQAVLLPRYLKSPNPRADYDWAKAETALKLAIQELGDDFRYPATLAKLYRERRITLADGENDQKADELIGQMIDDFPGDPGPLLARFLYGQAYWGESREDWKEDRNEALRLCEQAPEKWTVDLYLAAANVAREEQDMERTRAYLLQAIERFPKDSMPYLALVDLEDLGKEEGRVERKIELLTKASQNVEGLANVWFRILRAYEYATAGRTPELELEVMELGQFISRFQPPFANLVRLSLVDINAITLADEGKITAAATALENGLAQDEAELRGTAYAQQVAAVRMRLGGYYSRLRIHDLAAANFVNVGRIAPARFPRWRVLAAAEFASGGNPDESIRLLRSEVESGAVDERTLTFIAESEIRRQFAQPKRQRDWSRAASIVAQAEKAGLKEDAVAEFTARIADAQGKTAAAKQVLERVIQDGSDVVSPRFWQLLANLRWRTGDQKGAIAAANRFAQIQEDPLAAPQLRAAMLNESSRVDEALQVLRETMQLTSVDVDLARIMIDMAQILRGAGRNDEAREMLNQALVKQPDSFVAIDQLASIAWEEQKWDELEQYEKRLAELLPAQASVASFYEGIRLVEQAANRADERLTHAMRISSLLKDRRPQWTFTHILAGAVANKRGHPGEALRAYQTAWQRGMLHPAVANTILQLMSQLGRYDEAIAFVDQLQEQVTNSSQLFDQAIPYVKGRAYRQYAVRVASDWVRSEPENALAWARLGRILALSYERSKSLEQSRKAFVRAVRLDPGDVNVWLMAFGSYFGDESRRGEAIRIVEQFAAQTEVDPLQRAFVLAQFYEALQLNDKASQQYRRVIALSKEAEGNLQVPVLMRAAEFYSTVSPQLAERLFRRGLMIDPESIGGRLLFAGFLLDQGDEQLDEVEQLIAGIKVGPGANDAVLDQTRRVRAVFALRQADPRQIAAASAEMEALVQPTIDDQLILAGLYEKADRIQPAFDVLTALVRSNSAQPRECEAFIRFWQEHLLDPLQFQSLAEYAYERLIAESGELVPAFRLRLLQKLKEKRKETGNDEEPLDWADIVATIRKTATVTGGSYLEESQVRDIMIVLLQQNDWVDHAIRLLQFPPQEINADQTPAAMCAALIFAQVGSRQVREKVRGPLADQIAAHRQNAELVGIYADLLLIWGESEEAISNYQHLETLTSEDSWQRMNNLAAALSHTPEGKDRALEVMDQALEISPSNASLLDTKAMILQALGKPTEALGILQQLHKTDNTSASSLLHMAIICDDMGKSDAAKSAMVDALAMGCRMEILDKWDRSHLERLTQTFNL